MIKPKLLLDENIVASVAEQLRSQEFDAKSVLEIAPGMKDVGVLALAVRERRILVTLDKDFGNLIFRLSQKHVGVIFIRLQKESSEQITRILLGVLEAQGDLLEGKFATVTESSVRIR